MLSQTDVVGTCPTEVSSTGTNWDGVATYQKIKDMKSCQGNQKLLQYALNVPDVNIQQFPLIE